MRTIITHFYNEEHLLPWWLEHHKKYFDCGVLIDYGSTDRSVEIIKDICPNWYTFSSRFSKFDSHHLEYEVMWYERQIPSWRIAIPTTEFLIGDINRLTQDITERKQWIIPTLVFADFDINGKLDHSKKLWEQCFKGVHYKDLASKNAWQCRSLHNYNDIFYSAGRHYSNENTDRAMIFKYSNLLVGEPMFKRKLQIQDKVSDYDKNMNNAVTHCSLDSDKLTMDNLYENHKRLIGDTYDCTELMNSVLQYQ